MRCSPAPTLSSPRECEATQGVPRNGDHQTARTVSSQKLGSRRFNAKNNRKKFSRVQSGKMGQPRGLEPFFKADFEVKASLASWV